MGSKRNKSWQSAQYNGFGLPGNTFFWFPLSLVPILDVQASEVVIERVLGDCFVGSPYNIFGVDMHVEAGLIVMAENMIATSPPPPSLRPTGADGGLQWLWTKYMRTTWLVGETSNFWHHEVIDAGGRRRMEPHSEALWMYVNNFSLAEIFFNFNVRYLVSE